MVGWEWFAALLVGVTAAQLVLYYRLSRDADRPESRSREHGTVGPGGAAFGRPAGNGEREATAARVCPHCGAENEPDTAFSYCRDCVQSLP